MPIQRNVHKVLMPGCHSTEARALTIEVQTMLATLKGDETEAPVHFNCASLKKIATHDAVSEIVPLTSAAAAVDTFPFEVTYSVASQERNTDVRMLLGGSRLHPEALGEGASVNAGSV